MASGWFDVTPYHLGVKYNRKLKVEEEFFEECRQALPKIWWLITIQKEVLLVIREEDHFGRRFD